MEHGIGIQQGLSSRLSQTVPKVFQPLLKLEAELLLYIRNQVVMAMGGCFIRGGIPAVVLLVTMRSIMHMGSLPVCINNQYMAQAVNF